MLKLAQFTANLAVVLCCDAELTIILYSKISQSFERLMDIREALALLQIALYEVHHDLMIRSIDYPELHDTFGSLLNHKRFELGQEEPSVSTFNIVAYRSSYVC